jgi:hypothetical protein
MRQANQKLSSIQHTVCDFVPYENLPSYASPISLWQDHFDGPSGFSLARFGLIVKPDFTNCRTKTSSISNVKYLTNWANFSNEKTRYTVSCVTGSYKQVGE